MCGIVGIFDRRSGAVDPALVGRMNSTLVHRGPDEGNVHVGAGFGFGHRRLSILDLSPAGRQPFLSHDRTVVLTYNGEIYNFLALREQLEDLGYRFRSRCDTEVLVCAWQEWGEGCLDRLNGMFAFALWDERRKVFFMARDRLGIKPLYYADLPDGRLVFASELKALLVCPEVPRALDPYAVEDYFAYGYTPDPKTIFSGVRKLAPGCCLSLAREMSVPRLRTYWDVPFRTRSQRDQDEEERELVARLRAAVDAQRVADVPLGAFLSGGVDSSAVVAMMGDLAGDAVRTCSISFGDPAFNESRFAQAVADRYRTDHQVRQVEPNDFSLLDTLSGLYDEPFADSSAIPTYRVCQLARDRVTVALSGDGGDEDFAGYRRYRWHMYEERARRLLPQALRGPVFGALGALYPKMDWAPRVLRAKATLQGCARNSVDGYFHSVSILPDYLRRSLWSEPMRRELGEYGAVEVLRDHMANAPSDHPLSQVQYLDFKTYLPGDILTKVDRASMAHSLEVRVPLLDHEFVEWASGLDPSLSLRGREGKFLFKKALEPWVPHEVMYREKMGFAVPLGRWFRGPLAERMREAVLGERLRDSGLFDTKFLQRMVEEHGRGVRDFSAPLWTVLMFERFLAGLEGAVALTPPAAPERRVVADA